jgi:hypothetical protein
MKTAPVYQVVTANAAAGGGAGGAGALDPAEADSAAAHVARTWPMPATALDGGCWHCPVCKRFANQRLATEPYVWASDGRCGQHPGGRPHRINAA